MITLGEIHRAITDLFAQSGLESPNSLSEQLIADVLRYSRSDFFFNKNQQIESSIVQIVYERAQLCLQHVPLQHMKGSVEFYGLDIEVNPDVLIPRQETEILVEKIVLDLKKHCQIGKSLWDVCCGSGCIGIAVKKNVPDLMVIASDCCPKALCVAKRNAEKNQEEIEWLEGDLLEPFGQRTADYVVCNPPYISQHAFNGLDPTVKNHEPSKALIGGDSGTEFYERLALELPHYLNEQAKVWFEIGYDQGSALIQIFHAHYWSEKSVEKDWSGQDRFFVATFQKEQFLTTQLQ